MGKNSIRNVIVHISDDTDIHSLSNRINEFHVDIIERRLNQSNLTTEQKTAVIDKIIDELKSREIAGIIK